MEFINTFVEAYGLSFLMVIVLGFVIAMVTEIAVKKVFDYLSLKLGNKDWLPVAKVVSISVFTLVQVFYYTKLLVSALPFPGGIVLFPVWLSLVYLVQYTWSLLGFKRFVEGCKKFVEWCKRRAQRKAEEKAEEEAKKPQLTAVPGTTGLYMDAEGNYFDSKGRRM